MSKRRSSNQANTLFNYFQSPKGKQSSKDLNVSKSEDSNEEKRATEGDSAVTPKSISKKRVYTALIDSDSEHEGSTQMSMNVDESDSSDEKPIVRKPALKRSRIVKSDSDSDSDSTPLQKKKSKVKKDSRKAALSSYSFEKSASSNKENIKKKSSVSDTASATPQNNGAGNGGNWLHNKLDFLEIKNIRDINKKKSNDLEYDEKTLYVPEEFLNKQTPAMRQWWVLKSKHLDSVLFFKVGKFYELYHMDAVVGVNHIGLSYMKGEFAHSGFPESAYGRMASSLVEQGFKVVRVEQTETPEMMAERCASLKKAGKFDKVVLREICQITTKATCVYGAQLTDAKQALPCYMLAIAEKQLSSGTRFGVCFIDTSIGVFHLGEFDDDRHYSRLLALLAERNTGLILIERGKIQKSTSDLLKKTLPTVKIDALLPNSQFYSAQTTLDTLASGYYFKDKDDKFEWPDILKKLIDNVGSPAPEYELALKALGACVWYLKDSKIDIHVLTLKKFKIYHPVDATLVELKKKEFMVLDSVTIQNLSVLGSSGTLQKTLDQCETSFGKRLLQHWLCRPLCNMDNISKRQKAVKELFSNIEMLQATRSVLKKLPDLERQITKIHTFGNRFCAKYHPDSRAVLYESKTYSKRKILDLITTINGFEKAQELVNIFKGCEADMLCQLTQYPPKGKFPNLVKTLQFFREAFDQKQAETEGKIIPQSGVDNDYDEAEEAIEKLKSEVNEYLEEQQKFFGCKLTYFGTDKKRFQIEVPESATRKVTREYQLEGTKRGNKPAKRYSTPVTRRLLAEMIKAETRKNKIIQDLNRRIFEKFSDRREEWEQSIQCLMVLDVICSFAEYARTVSGNICFPTILPVQNEPFINIEDGVHPCTMLEDFVPNSTKLGTEGNARIMLLTGPNMGGKSTLMRQVALIIIMAQMGCPVPAVNCEMSLVDRIFTRLGAHDDILQGQSTFLVELSEASAILQHATCHSFVLLDELGRGTSTHDGNAIATAYVNKLISIQCRTIFSTHYHSLVEKFSGRSDIELAHMACMVNETENEDDSQQSITLLYQLHKGSCPKSYGFYAAKLAGLPSSITRRALEIANNLETMAKVRRLMSELFIDDDIVKVRHLLKSI